MTAIKVREKELKQRNSVLSESKTMYLQRKHGVTFPQITPTGSHDNKKTSRRTSSSPPRVPTCGSCGLRKERRLSIGSDDDFEDVFWSHGMKKRRWSAVMVNVLSMPSLLDGEEDIGGGDFNPYTLGNRNNGLTLPSLTEKR